jgi:hypothetical protein
MDHRAMKTKEELAVYKAICRLPMQLDEMALLLKKDFGELVVEHELDFCQGNMMKSWLMSEVRRYKMQHLSGNRSDDVQEFLERLF